MRQLFAAVGIGIGIAGSAGCMAAPPMGLGAGAHTLAPDRVLASAGAGVAAGRDTVHVDAGLTEDLSGPWLLEYGAAYSQVAIRTDDGATVHAYGLVPYLRPRVQAGRWSLALGGFLIGFSGGEVGSIGMVTDIQAGVGGDAWSVYAGGYGLAYAENAAAEVSTLALQARAGGELLLPFAGARVGIGVEVYRQVEALQHMPRRTFESSFWGAGFKLRFELARTRRARLAHERAVAARTP